MGSVRQLPYFAGGRMFLFRVLYSPEGRETPLMICLVLGRIGLSQDVNAISLLDFGETAKRIAGGPTTDKPVQEYCATPPSAPPVTDQS
jgi:hypothetical protein